MLYGVITTKRGPPRRKETANMNTITGTEADPTHVVVVDADDASVLAWWALDEDGSNGFTARDSAIRLAGRTRNTVAYATLNDDGWKVYA